MSEWKNNFIRSIYVLDLEQQFYICLSVRCMVG